MSEGKAPPPLGALLRLGHVERPDAPIEYVEVIEIGQLGIRLRRGALKTSPKDWPQGTPLVAIAYDVPARSR